MQVQVCDYDAAAESFDLVVNHLFSSGLTLASVLSCQQIPALLEERLLAVLDELDAAVCELRNGAIRIGVHDRASAVWASA